jgi:hypothetical protein
MLDHMVCQLALRTRLLTLSVATTGSATLAATAAGYTRGSGSFVTDGFTKGMEVAPTGFTQTDVGVVADVAALTLTIDGGRTVQSSGAGRTLAVGLPAIRAWENQRPPVDPIPGRPWVEENYLPGPVALQAIGAQGALWATPMYVLKLYHVADKGVGAANAYAKALLTLFAPTTAITLSTGDVLQVRGDVAPFLGQLIQAAPGYAVRALTIPLQVQSANA